MRHWLLIIVFLLPISALAEDTGDKSCLEGVKQFNAAYQAWDGGKFDSAAELLRQAGANSPQSGGPLYWLGVTHFHHMLQIQSQPAADSKNAEAKRDAALETLEMAVESNPRNAEVHALLGTLYGMKIQGSLIRGVRFGPRVAESRKRALEFGADNPRVHYLLGTCQFHTAKTEEERRAALATFLKAEGLFEAEGKTTAGPLDPRWGYDSCLAFTALTYEQLGAGAKAADYFRKALARRPSDRMAKDGLARVTQKK